MSLDCSRDGPLTPDHCLCCRRPNAAGHEEACLQAEHEAMLAGDPAAVAEHEPDECYHCLLDEAVSNECRCGNCCRALIIETCLQDAEVEPLIKERGSPIYTGPEFTASGQREIQGYLLNGKAGHCVFLDDGNNLCTIYATRPLVCRLFQCDGSEVSGAAPMDERAS
jgi:Fe-S-cluster containining protein